MMSHYIIIETEDGFRVEGVPANETSESVARSAGAVLIDEGPYGSYTQAMDALMLLPNPYEQAKQ